MTRIVHVAPPEVTSGETAEYLGAHVIFLPAASKWIICAPEIWADCQPLDLLRGQVARTGQCGPIRRDFAS